VRHGLGSILKAARVSGLLTFGRALGTCRCLNIRDDHEYSNIRPNAASFGQLIADFWTRVCALDGGF